MPQNFPPIAITGESALAERLAAIEASPHVEVAGDVMSGGLTVPILTAEQNVLSPAATFDALTGDSGTDTYELFPYGSLVDTSQTIWTTNTITTTFQATLGMNLTAANTTDAVIAVVSAVVYSVGSTPTAQWYRAQLYIDGTNASGDIRTDVLSGQRKFTIPVLALRAGFVPSSTGVLCQVYTQAETSNQGNIGIQIVGQLFLA